MLLKNDADLLPAAHGLQRILVIGRHADVGVLCGGGSSAVTPLGSIVEPSGIDRVWADRVYQPSPPLRAIQAEARAAHVDFLDGTDHAAAVTAARDADLVVIIAEEWRAEGLDSQGVGLPDGQEKLIEQVAAANPRTVVVIESGGAISVPWALNVPAVIAAFYPGGGGGPAIAGVLFGRVNPSGHLPVTFPTSIDQLPRPEQHDPATTTSNPNMERIGEIFEVSYDIEGSDVGYRWFEREQLTPDYPFGWGLSYTTFAFSGLSVTAHGREVSVSGTITNTGDRTGAGRCAGVRQPRDSRLHPQRQEGGRFRSSPGRVRAGAPGARGKPCSRAAPRAPTARLLGRRRRRVPDRRRRLRGAHRRARPRRGRANEHRPS